MLYPKLVLMALFWSGVFPALNILLQSMGLFTSVFLRFALASLVLLALLRLREGRFPRLSPREAVLVLGLGLIGITVYNCLFAYGLSLVEASRAALIVPTSPAFTALLAALLLREPLGATRAAGVALSMLGALWALGRGSPASLAAFEFGVGEAVLGAGRLIWSGYTLVGRVAMSSMSPLALTAYAMALGSVPIAIPAWIEPAPLSAVTWQGWAALAYLVVATVLPFLWYYEGVKALGAARAAQFINLVPPLAVLQAVVLLGETVTQGLFVGMALVVAGLYLTNKPR